MKKLDCCFTVACLDGSIAHLTSRMLILVLLSDATNESTHENTVMVTRLIRISYGDYQLQTIPPGMAIPVPLKPVEQHKKRGPLFPAYSKRSNTAKDNTKKLQNQQSQQQAQPIRWKKMH